MIIQIHSFIGVACICMGFVLLCCPGVDYKFYLPARLATSNVMLLQKTTSVARSFSDGACSACSTYVSMQMLQQQFCFEFGHYITHQNTKHRTPRDHRNGSKQPEKFR